ncbi:hypothetical protein ACWD5V_16090 [Streptomyces sp. NPDC002523]
MTPPGTCPGSTAQVTERDNFKVFKLAKNGTRTQVGSVPNAVTTDGEGGLLDRSSA